MTQFNIGDTVQLKSGSPIMTIYNITNGFVDCIFYNTNLSKFDYFNGTNPNCLFLVEKAKV